MALHCDTCLSRLTYLGLSRQAKTTEDRIAAAKARIERATNAISKKSNGAADDTKLEATPPPTTRRTSEEPMQTSDKSASDAAQNGTDAAETSEEPTKIVNGDGEEVDAMSALS